MFLALFMNDTTAVRKNTKKNKKKTGQTVPILCDRNIPVVDNLSDCILTVLQIPYFWDIELKIERKNVAHGLLFLFKTET